MQALLKGFSQEIDLADTDTVNYFLVFDIEGREERLPVPHTTVERLTHVIYGKQVKVAEADLEEDEQEMETFSPNIPEGAETYEAPEEEFEEDEEEVNPLSEDEVPSL